MNGDKLKLKTRTEFHHRVTGDTEYFELKKHQIIPYFKLDGGGSFLRVLRDSVVILFSRRLQLGAWDWGWGTVWRCLIVFCGEGEHFGDDIF